MTHELNYESLVPFPLIHHLARTIIVLLGVGICPGGPHGIMLGTPHTRNARGTAMIGKRTVLAAAFAMMVAPMGATSAQAQILRGVVVEVASQQPVPAVLLSLIDSDDRVMQRFMVGPDGEFRFILATPGTYSLLAERLGMATRTVQGLTVAPSDTVSVRISLEHRPIALEGIEASGDRRCELEADIGEQTHRVWDAARKTLDAARFTESTGTYRYDLDRYSRILDSRTLRIRNETRTARRTNSRRPIESLPVEYLLEEGWATSSSAGSHYFAPDAHALLSDEFLENYCFQLRARDESPPDLVGLEFRPVQTPGGRTDIEGVLWLSRETGALQWLDYTYLNLPGAANRYRGDHAGGRVEFHGLPDGTWIVSNWYIRMPLLSQQRNRGFQRVAGWVNGIAEDGGGVVRAISTATGRTAYADASGTITGEVRDPGRGAPFTPGRVTLVGTSTEVDLDSEGRFEIGDLPAGGYQVALLQPSLRGLDRGYALVGADIFPGDTARVRLEAPPASAVMAAACGRDAGDWVLGTGVLLGDVVETDSQIAIAGATVVAEWLTIARPRTQVQAETRTVETATNELGGFRVCGVPADGTTIRVTVSLDGRSSTAEVWLSYAEPVGTVSFRLEG